MGQLSETGALKLARLNLPMVDRVILTEAHCGWLRPELQRVPIIVVRTPNV
jgi:hypothetical protein